jgi:adenosylcobinamide-GDP ribazoletransferase
MRKPSLLLIDLQICIGFCTWLPVSSTLGGSDRAFSFAEFHRAVRMLPVAGALLGTLAALALGSLTWLGVPPLLSAPLTISLLAALTGAIHEDGLADCADGFFGGETRERRLEIMRDSRTGTYGAAALALTLYIRSASLAILAGKSLALACLVLAAAAAVSRTAALLPLFLLPPARQDGAGFAAGKPGGQALVSALIAAALFAFAPACAGASLFRPVTGLVLATAAASAMTALAKHKIGGQTGDVAGAAQQLSELGFYLAFAAQP